MFIPLEQSYVLEFKHIITWINMGKEEKTCVSRTWLVGLFEVHWKTPYHVLLMEFLDTWREKKGEDILLALD